MTVPTPIKGRSGSPDDNAPHILVVDDDSRIRDLLARYLQDHGFRVTTAIDRPLKRTGIASSVTSCPSRCTVPGERRMRPESNALRSSGNSVAPTVRPTTSV